MRLATRENDNTGLGTFAGVFTPSILTILGIVLFLRLGYIVGGSGLQQALVIIAIANAISILTSFSIAAISTNLTVKAGGDYYLISRTLGLGFGGAIGLVLFFAQAVSIGFYCIGFAEAVRALLGQTDALTLHLLAVAAIGALAVLAWLGADWATRFQYVVMAAIFLALGVFFFGGFAQWDRGMMMENWQRPEDGLPFWVAFAIFFPAVTGFTQGVSMSGELANPSRSIPLGVFCAVFLSVIVYFSCAVLLSGTLSQAELRTDYMAMKQVAILPFLIDAGLIAATLSSALASFLGAPRILQSLAKDEILPAVQPFARGVGPSENPRRAVVLTTAIALVVVLIGNLNVIASVVSMFFLISYGLLNYATYYESRTESPSFRPTFRLYHPMVGLVGALACLSTMLAIDFAAGVVAVAVVLAVYQYLESRAPPARWADSRRSHHLHEVRQHLLAAAAEEEHPRNWRPQLLVFSDSSERRQRLLRFASWIEAGSGLTTVVQVVTGYGETAIKQRETALSNLANEIKDGSFTAFPLVVAGKDVDQTISAVVQSSGIGPVRANTIIANWAKDSPSFTTPLGVQRLSDNLRTAFAVGCNLLILDADTAEWTTLENTEPDERVIDVWWRPNKTGELMLLLAHLVTRDRDWSNARIRILAEPNEGETGDETVARLRSALESYRIDAELVVADHGTEAYIDNSRNSSLVFLPFSIHASRFYGPAGGELSEYIKELPVVVLAMAAQDVDLAADPDVADESPEETGGQAPPNGAEKDDAPK